tara:strand:- start:412 stop:1269 length:858 start_codon:yes stop_codon:yes gene_type:complete
MRILVTGSRGQLGSELKKKSIKQNFDWLFTDRENFDLSKLDSINYFLDKSKPNMIINCAAYTNVDMAEDNLKLANLLNHQSIELIAKWCNNNNCRLIHFSTDYVFDGNSHTPYNENDNTNPLNNYGKTKLLGDIACVKEYPMAIIIRTSWLYSSFGNNFVKKMIDLMQKKTDINVVNDQFGSPTFALDLVNVIIQIIKNKKWFPGIYNFTNNGSVSWYHFANTIKSIIGSDTVINPISSANYNSKAKRPKKSILDNSKIINTYQIKESNYIDSLNKCIKILQNES